MKKLTNAALSVIGGGVLLFATGCGSSGNQPTPVEPLESPTPVPAVTEVIKLNQLGYQNNAQKYALVPNVGASQFSIVSVSTGAEVFRGPLSDAFSWEPSGDSRYRLADFTDFQQSGEYRLEVDGAQASFSFEIGDGLLLELRQSALRYFYLNRAGMEIHSEYAGPWQRPSGHADTRVSVHASAAGANLSLDEPVTSSKGWYDAGDYGKYVVNSAIATYTLIAAYEHYPNRHFSDATNIPESGNGIADLIDEAKWNLDWMFTMQANDGSVVHKLTSLEWPGKEMSDEDTRERFLIGKSTSAALGYAATMAAASRVYRSASAEFSEQAEQWQESAVRAWEWASANPNVAYTQPADVKSGEYGDDFFNDEFAWAAAELFVTTGDERYWQAFNHYKVDVQEASWQYVSALPYLTLLTKGQTLLSDDAYQRLATQLTEFADRLLQLQQGSLINLPISESDFVWGSNAVMMNKAIVLLQAHQLTQDIRYLNAAQQQLNYVLGYNPTGFSFVTGYGDQTPLDPHHRISISDDISEPHPGMLVGGPHAGRQDGCDYPDTSPAGSYIDDWCSYSTNEVAINWNAPFYYVLTALSE